MSHKCLINPWEPMTPEGAYVLGYFTGDGGLHRTKRLKKDGTPDSIIHITSKDKLHLQKIAQVFGLAKELSVSSAGTSKEIYRIYTADSWVVNYITSIGYDEKYRELDHVFFGLSEDHKRCYVRGLFDADGSVCVSVANYLKRGNVVYISPTILATKNLIETLSNYLRNLEFDLNVRANYKTSKGDDLYQIVIRQKSVNSFKEWLYCNSTIHLERKYDKFNSDGSGYKVIYHRRVK